MVIVTRIYGSQHKNDREQLWNFVLNTSFQMDQSWLLIGDFNQVKFLAKKYNASSKMDGAKHFRAPFFGVWYMWSNNKNGHELIMERLDKAFGNEKWLLWYPPIPYLLFSYNSFGPCTYSFRHGQAKWL